MEYTRWYDKDNQLKFIMETLEKMDRDIQLSVAQDLMQMILQTGKFENDVIIEKLNDTYVPVRRRWYDQDDTVLSAIEMIKFLDEETKKEILSELIYSIIYFKKSEFEEDAE